MKKSNAINHFGTCAAVADALGIRPQAVHKWPPAVPIKRAVILEQITHGRLAVDWSCYPKLQKQAAR